MSLIHGRLNTTPYDYFILRLKICNYQFGYLPCSSVKIPMGGPAGSSPLETRPL